MKIILLTSTVKVVCNRTFYSNTGNRPTTTKLCKLYTDCQSVEVVNKLYNCSVDDHKSWNEQAARH